LFGASRFGWSFPVFPPFYVAADRLARPANPPPLLGILASGFDALFLPPGPIPIVRHTYPQLQRMGAFRFWADSLPFIFFSYPCGGERSSLSFLSFPISCRFFHGFIGFFSSAPLFHSLTVPDSSCNFPFQFFLFGGLAFSREKCHPLKCFPFVFFFSCFHLPPLPHKRTRSFYSVGLSFGESPLTQWSPRDYAFAHTHGTCSNTNLTQSKPPSMRFFFFFSGFPAGQAHMVPCQFSEEVLTWF